MAAGGGSEPAGGGGGGRGQDQGSEIHLKEFQSPVEAGESSRKHELGWPVVHRNSCLHSAAVIVSEPWNGGSVHQHAAESGPEPDNCGPVGDVFRILHYSERQSDRRETQSEFSCLRQAFLVKHIKISSEKRIWGERTSP